MGLLSSKLSSREMAFLCRQLATSYGAGISLLSAFELASKHGGSQKTRLMLTRMSDAVRNGASLDDAVRAERKLLPEMFMEVVHAGEVGGRLDEMFTDLADYYENIVKMWRSSIAAMIYPILQLLSAWFLGTFSLGLVGRFDPFSTERFVMREYVHGYILFQIESVLIFTAVIVLLIFLGRMGMLHLPWAVLKNIIWPFRHISNKFAMARFFRTLSLLIGAGLNIRQCIERSAAVTLNPLIERDLLQAIPVIMNGGTLVQAFSRSKYINRVGKEMIAVGEQSGRLDATLKKVAEYHYNEAQAALHAATKIMFVATMLIVGVIIGGIVIYFYMNMYGSLMKGI